MPPLALLAALLPASEPAATAGPVSYFRDVRPIFAAHCQGCHQPAKANGGYQMLTRADMLKAGESGKPGVVPGKPAASYLMDEIRLTGGKAEMPKGRDPLDAKQIALVEKWIAEGAADDTPASAKTLPIDADHPPVYQAAPVVPAIAFSPDGKLLAVAGYHEVLLHAADGSKLVGRLVGMSERVQAVAFSPDGKRLAVSGGDPGRVGEIQIWDVAKQKLKDSTTATFDTLYGVSWSPDGTKVAVGGADNIVRAFDADTGKQVLQMGVHSDWVLGTVFSRDGLHLASVSRDQTVKLTEVTTQRFIDNVTSITPGALKGGLMTVDRRPVTAQKLQKVPEDTPGAAPLVYDELLVAGADGTPRLYKMHRESKRVIGDDANKVKQYEPLPGRISSAVFAPDGKTFAAASSLDGKGTVRVVNADDGKTVATAEKITGPVYAVAYAPDGKTLASAGFDGIVWLHDPATGKLKTAFPAAPLKSNTTAAR